MHHEKANYIVASKLEGMNGKNQCIRYRRPVQAFRWWKCRNKMQWNSKRCLAWLRLEATDSTTLAFMEQSILVCVRLEPVRNDNSTYAHMDRYVTLHCSYRLLTSRRHLHTFLIQILLLYLLLDCLLYPLSHRCISIPAVLWRKGATKNSYYRFLRSKQKIDLEG